MYVITITCKCWQDMFIFTFMEFLFKTWLCEPFTLIQQYDPRTVNKKKFSYFSLFRNTVHHQWLIFLSHGASIGGIRVFVHHTCGNKHKQNASTIFVRHVAFHACLLSCSERSAYNAPDESRLFWSWEKPRIPPIWAPCRDKDGTGSGISGLYLQHCHTLSQQTHFTGCLCFKPNVPDCEAYPWYNHQSTRTFHHAATVKHAMHSTRKILQC